MSTYPERMRTSSTAGFVSVWVAEYPTEEDARAELDRRIAESYPTGTTSAGEWSLAQRRSTGPASSWEWSIGQHSESHRLAVAGDALPADTTRRRRRSLGRSSLLQFAHSHPANGPPAVPDGTLERGALPVT